MIGAGTLSPNCIQLEQYKKSWVMGQISSHKCRRRMIEIYLLSVLTMIRSPEKKNDHLMHREGQRTRGGERINDSNSSNLS